MLEPPDGFVYVDYSTALATGALRVRGDRHQVRAWSAADVLIFVVHVLETLLRRAGVMYREPIWFVTIDADRIDLVHQHLFAVRQVGCRIPVVSSAGMPLGELYRARERWSRTRVALATALERWYAQAIDAHVPWLRGTRGNVMTVYSRAFASKIAGHTGGVDPLIASTGIPAVQASSRSDGQDGVLAFIGRDFTLKGGDLALAAFRLVNLQRPNTTLLIATGSGSALPVIDNCVELHLDAPRDFVIQEILARADVLLAPTRVDCGAPYGVLEALRAGVAVVMSPVIWLDDRLRGDGILFADSTASAIAAAALRLLDLSTTQRQDAARDVWQRNFTMRRLHEDLSRAYRLALNPAWDDDRGGATAGISGSPS